MSIHVALHHRTAYTYDRPIQLDAQVVRLRPAPHCRSRILSYSLKVEPADHFINWQQDPFANHLARLVFNERTTAFSVTVDLVVEMAVHNPFDFFLEPEAETFPFAYSKSVREELQPYLVVDRPTPLINGLVECIKREIVGGPSKAAAAAGIAPTRRRTIDVLVDINQLLQREIQYVIRLEPGVQAPEDTLDLASGSCRDSAWLMVQLLRRLGLAARFCSGYLIQLAPDVKSLEGPTGAEYDFTDLHAWCEVFLPGAGWIGFDPTSGLLAGEGHLPLACTPQPSSAAPIEGMLEDCEVEFGHEMSIQRIYGSPRVTRPYTEEQWNAIYSLGQQVDVDLAAQDVRLTMGGEPTFVADRDRDAAEWNTDALGPTKRIYAMDLVRRLRDRYAPNGLLHFGQGKWYPGEQLPRWALGLFWRADGEPIWLNPDLYAREDQPRQLTSDDAERFIRQLTQRLGLTDKTIQPGYEDTYYYLWRERCLPINVDPFDSRLDDELERSRLRRIFDTGLSAVVGYLLPLKATELDPALEGPRFTTGPWFLRDDRLHLIPGDSPMGYRLPLDSLPWVKSGDQPLLQDRDPADPALGVPLPSHEQLMMAQQRPSAEMQATMLRLQPRLPEARGRLDALHPAPVAAEDLPAPARFESAHWLTRTALCVEVRDPQRANGPKAEKLHGGKSQQLYVFMPPLARLEDYLALVAAVEATAGDLNLPVILEGYPPPRDPRLKSLAVTPDPGVIEVNIHPAHSWSELVENTEFLYQAAFACHLVAEKFMVDGRHTGTGGGNHFVLGGATPLDSPFLRRPDLLASLLAFWHNHPSLSYLFSGMFIGPTSQSPRVDEARNDQLYELEIALEQIRHNVETTGAAMPPWLLDRTLRNILVDVTGNTHRSEFSIDKLYSPDGPTGRLGLLELRAFEMPPHARMSAVQQLLLRALLAWFWRQPYQATLVRWGTELHDRWLMPAFIQEDIHQVLAELGHAGYDMPADWFAPHLEFRLPLVGELQLQQMRLTLRNALEPWHVMGEEGAPGGTARYVDSSLERLEVRITGYTPARYALMCNGQPVALQATGVAGDYVGAVRFKAWNPPSSLHPSIGVHAPLTFDLVDLWNGRSVGGCQYHVVHPGGRSYDTFPINAYEAESRRLSRFFRMNHTGGPMAVRPASTFQTPASPEFPFSLDLRRRH